MGPGLRGRRPGGQLARPAPARVAARLGAAGRRRWPAGDRRPRSGSLAPAAGRGAPAVLRRGHPGPPAAASSPRSPATRNSRRVSSTSSTRCRTATGRSTACRRAACTCPAWSPSCGRRLRPAADRRPTARPPPRQLARLAAAGVRGADPDHWWGLARALRRRPGRRPGPGRCRSARRGSSLPALRAARAAAGRSARRDGDRRSPRRWARWCTRSRRAGAAGRRRSSELERAARRAAGAASTSAPPGMRRNERAPGQRDAGRAGRRGCAAAAPSLELVGDRGAVRGRRRRCACSPAGSTGSSATRDGRLVVIDLKTGKTQGQGRRGRRSTRSSAPTRSPSRRRVRRRATAAGGARAGAAGRDRQAIRSSARRPLAESEDPDWIHGEVAQVADAAARHRVHRRGQRAATTATCGTAARCSADGRQVTDVSTARPTAVDPVRAGRARSASPRRPPSRPR